MAFWMRNRRIANFFINPRFQWSFIRQNLWLAIFVNVIVYGANFWFFEIFERKGLELGLPTDHVFFRFIVSQRQTMNQIFMAAALVVFLLIVVQGMRFSHRIAGPLYRLKQDMLAISATGKFRQIRFRKGDYFQELPEGFNQLENLFGKE